MKCVKISGEKMLEVSEINTPESNGNVIFKVDACGICGSDIHYWDMGEPKGLVMGHEFSGTVLNPGDRTDLEIGDKITGLPISPCEKCEACLSGNPQYCSETWSKAVGLSFENPGGYAFISSCRPDMVKKLPRNMTSIEGAMVEPSAVSLHAVNLAKLNSDSKVLIIGGGIIGLMCAEFARLKGVKYIAMLETNPKRGEKSLKYGKVDEYYNALDEKTIPTLLEKTNGGFDVVLECCGNAPAVTEALMTVKPGGSIILAGVSTVPVNIPLALAVTKELNIQGVIAYTVKEFEDCINYISEKKIDVEKYVDDVVGLDKVQESFERLTSGEDSAVKIIIKP